MSNATLALKSMQDIKDRTAVGILAVSLTKFAKSEQGCRLRELGKGHIVSHLILTYTAQHTLIVCLRNCV